MSPRTLRILLPALVLVAVAVFAGQAFAADGVGLSGRTTDKTIMYWAFALIAFFPLLVTVLTIVQSKREARKRERKSAIAQLRR